MTALTDTDLDAIERRLAESRIAAALPRLVPLTGWAKEAFETQEAKRQERAAAAAAEEERLRGVRVANDERRRQLWERNAPKRAVAAAELAKVEQELAAVDSRRDKLVDRSLALLAEATR